jgi:branched-subunit amino acid aminotransferase/4-amino-4-deoxychorismate lyase
MLWADGAWVAADSAGLLLERLDQLRALALAESLQLSKGKVLHLTEHLDRLAEGCRALGWPEPDRGLLTRVARAMPGHSGARECGLRLRWWGGLGRPLLLCQAVPAPALPARGIVLMTSAVRHYGPDSLNGRAKVAHMLPNWLARAETQAWAEDGLRLTPGGLVAEGVWTNLVALKRGVARTPPLSEGVLEGVTRALLLKQLRARGLQVREEPLTRYDLWTADKVWVTSSLRGRLPVLSVDGRVLGARPARNQRRNPKDV